MILDYLEPLANGRIPEQGKYNDLNEERKKLVSDFVSKIPEKFSLDEVKQDIAKLSDQKSSVEYKIVSHEKAVITIGTIAVFILYCCHLGFLFGVAGGIVSALILIRLVLRIKNMVGISQTSMDLLNEYESLLDKQALAQYQENKSK